MSKLRMAAFATVATVGTMLPISANAKESVKDYLVKTSPVPTKACIDISSEPEKKKCSKSFKYWTKQLEAEFVDTLKNPKGFAVYGIAKKPILSLRPDKRLQDKRGQGLIAGVKSACQPLYQESKKGNLEDTVLKVDRCLKRIFTTAGFAKIDIRARHITEPIVQVAKALKKQELEKEHKTARQNGAYEYQLVGK